MTYLMFANRENTALQHNGYGLCYMRFPCKEKTNNVWPMKNKTQEHKANQKWAKTFRDAELKNHAIARI